MADGKGLQGFTVWEIASKERDRDKLCHVGAITSQNWLGIIQFAASVPGLLIGGPGISSPLYTHVREQELSDLILQEVQGKNVSELGALAWDLEEVSSVPCSASAFLCDLRKCIQCLCLSSSRGTSPLCASCFPSLKRG